MDIYRLLPIELQNKINYFVLSHPIAEIIKYEISRLRCDEYYTFRDNQNKVLCKIDGRCFFTNEYFFTICLLRALFYLVDVLISVCSSTEVFQWSSSRVY